jgi:hypothetical protein
MTTTAIELELCRSDTGDGGWSLHLTDDDSTLVLDGPSDADSDGEWLRPDPADYDDARRLAEAGVYGVATETHSLYYRGRTYQRLDDLIAAAQS